MKYCHECRIKNGYKRKTKGAHTAILMNCECCGERRAILPDRHWMIDDK